MKPIIGIVGINDISKNGKQTISVIDNYRKAIIEYGGIPFLILPPQLVNYGTMSGKEIGNLSNDDIEILNNQIAFCDGILIPGGERSFDYHRYICKYANENKVPLLGICMGMQTMCNYNNENKNILNDNNIHKSPRKNYVHEVILDLNSKLYNIINKKSIIVNSNHNYHVPNSGNYNATIFSFDGLIEGVEKDDYFNIGVQWHPEKKYKDEISSSLFNEFIKSAIKFKKSNQ